MGILNIRRDGVDSPAMTLPEAPENLRPTQEEVEVHRDVSSGVVRLRTTEWRAPHVDPNSTPIVALPGVLAPRLSYRALARCLSSEFRVIAVDFPGFGESEKPSLQRYNYGVDAFADAIADLFAGLNIAQAHLLGHGVGGAVALKLAAGHPEFVKRLALIAPLAPPASNPLNFRHLLAPVLGGLLLRQLIGKSWFFRLYRERINPEISSELLDEYYEALSPPASRGALLATLRASQDTRSLIADSRRIRAPTLLLWGRDDRLFPVEQGRYLAREMPHTGLELFSSSHAPHEQCPEEAARVLAAFFDGRRAGSRS